MSGAVHAFGLLPGPLPDDVPAACGLELFEQVMEVGGGGRAAGPAGGTHGAWAAAAASRNPASSSQPQAVVAMNTAPKVSPAPVGSTAVTGSDGTCTVVPARVARAPSLPRVTTAVST
ncbi:MAG: hypothetical protein WAW78_12235 [Propioniciclava sp.]